VGGSASEEKCRIDVNAEASRIHEEGTRNGKGLHGRKILSPIDKNRPEQSARRDTKKEGVLRAERDTLPKNRSSSETDVVRDSRVRSNKGSGLGNKKKEDEEKEVEKPPRHQDYSGTAHTKTAEKGLAGKTKGKG